MQFYFIRHAQSANNALWDATQSSKGRSYDPELTQAGIRQAELLARFLTRKSEVVVAPHQRDAKNLAGFNLTHLYCSLMLRAVQTGSIVAEATGLPLNAWINAHEEGGLYLEDEETGARNGKPGFSRAHFAEHFPLLQLPEEIGDEGWWNRPFEEYEEREMRAASFLSDLLQRHGGTPDRVGVISHGGFYNLLIQAILQCGPGQDRWFSMNNTAITRIDFENNRLAVVYMNRTDHLPDALIT